MSLGTIGAFVFLVVIVLSVGYLGTRSLKGYLQWRRFVCICLE